MPDKQISISRTALYQKVWSTPLKRLAVEFGISDVGLAKLCRRHDIPLPGRGHWARIEFGQKPVQAPLPAAKSQSSENILITPSPPKLYPPIVKGEMLPKVVIEVEDNRQITHALAIRTKRVFQHATKGIRDILIPKEGQASHLVVTEDALPRALRILDALLAGVEEAHHSAVWEKAPASRLHFRVDGEEIHFRLSETFDQKAHVPTKEELTRKQNWNYWNPPKWDQVPSGRLRLSIENLPYGVKLVQHSWADGKRQQLESCLGEFVFNLPSMAAALKLDRVQQERRRLEREEEERRAEEERRQRREYERKVEILQKLHKEWEESASLAAFAEAFLDVLARPGVNEEIRDKLKPIAEWSGRYAAALDPLSRLEQVQKQFFPPPGTWWG